MRSLARLLLVPVAALIVHQLRFALAFGGDASLALAQQGHAYLHSLVPWVALLGAAAAGAFLWALGRALAGQRTVARYTVSLAGLWFLCSLSLVAIYVSQELLEGVFATGHPAGLAGVFGYGGWWSIPVSVCVGLVLATIIHGARWALDAVARRTAPGQPHVRRADRAMPRVCDALLPALTPLADGWSGRGPPAEPLSSQR
jgi:hypothetical protein